MYMVEIYVIVPDFEAVEGFEWDAGNIDKNFDKHNVSNPECEEVFMNEPLLIFPDSLHSETEDRYSAFGKTNQFRFLAITFIIRNRKIRVVSARDMSAKEKRQYENT